MDTMKKFVRQKCFKCAFGLNFSQRWDGQECIKFSAWASEVKAAKLGADCIWKKVFRLWMMRKGKLPSKLRFCPKFSMPVVTQPVVTSMPEPKVDVADVYSSWGAADGFPSMDSWFPLSGDKWVKITIFFIFIMTLLQILRHLSIFMLCSNQPASRQTNLTSAKKGIPTCQFGVRFKMKHCMSL